MRLETGSASSFKQWKQCPAGWAAIYANPTGIRTPTVSHPAGANGSALHDALEAGLKAGVHELPEEEQKHRLVQLYDIEFPKQYPDGDPGTYYDQGVEMLHKWVERHPPEYWEGREIVAMEREEKFELPTSQGPLPFTAFFDRLDRLGPGIYEVVDYKSWAQYMTPADMRFDIQFRLYGMLCKMLYPDATEIWVTADQLRHQSTSVLFSDEDLTETFQMLIRMAEDIIATEKPKEVINGGCRFCVRVGECDAWRSQLAVSGPQTISDWAEAAREWAQLKAVQGALYSRLDDLDAMLRTELNHLETDELSNGEVEVLLESDSKRSVDAQMAARVLGDQHGEFVVTYGNPGVGSIERACKDGFGDVALRQKLSSLIQTNTSGTKLKIKEIKS